MNAKGFFETVDERLENMLYDPVSDIAAGVINSFPKALNDVAASFFNVLGEVFLRIFPSIFQKPI